MKKATLLVAAALCVTACSPTVQAQDLGGVYDMGQLSQSLSLGSMMHAQSERDAARLKGRRGQGNRVIRGGGSSTGLRGSTRFRTSLAARRSFLANIVAKARATNPQAAAALQRDFAKGDPIVTIAPALARYGLRTDDVADSMAVYLISAYYGVRGSTQDPSRSSLRATRDQMRRALLTTPSFASSSNAAKQQMSDALLLQTMVTNRLVTSAKGNPAQMASAKSSIRQGALKIFKLDLSKMKLTNSGLRS